MGQGVILKIHYPKPSSFRKTHSTNNNDYGSVLAVLYNTKFYLILKLTTEGIVTQDFEKKPSC